MNAVTPIEATVKPTIESACRWIQQKGERGEIPMSTARFKITALKQLIGVLADDEPREDVHWVLANIESISKRWATKNSGKYGGETIKTYESRARSGLEDYLRWLDNPATFRFTRERDQVKAKVAREVKASKTERTEKAEKAERTDEGTTAFPRGASMRTFPLPKGRVFRFELPEGEISVDDVRRMALHLLSYAGDLDPTMPAEAFAIVRRDN